MSELSGNSGELTPAQLEAMRRILLAEQEKRVTDEGFYSSWLMHGNTLNGLARKGYIEMRDAKNHLVRLTPAGRARVAHERPAMSDNYKDARWNAIAWFDEEEEEDEE